MYDLVPLPNNNVNIPVWKKSSVVCFSAAILGHPFGCFPSNSVHYLIQNDCALFFLFIFLLHHDCKFPLSLCFFFFFLKKDTISAATLSPGSKVLTPLSVLWRLSKMCLMEIISWKFSGRSLYFIFRVHLQVTCHLLPATADTVCIYSGTQTYRYIYSIMLTHPEPFFGHCQEENQGDRRSLTSAKVIRIVLLCSLSEPNWQVISCLDINNIRQTVFPRTRLSSRCSFHCRW